MHIVIRAHLGDEVALTAFVREVKKQYPEEPIVIDGKYPEVWKYNTRLEGKGKHTLPTVQMRPWATDYQDKGPLPICYAHQAGGMVVSDPTPEVFVGGEDQEKAQILLGGAKGSPGLVAIDPWAAWTSRRWEFERWVVVCKMLQSDGWGVVEVGRETPDEQGNIQTGLLPANVQLHNKTSVLEVAAVLRVCKLFVGSDSGLFHLAAAVGTPQVVLFGPKPWYSRAYWNTVPVYSSVNCSSSCGMTCVLPRHCLRDIHAGDVQRAVDVASERFYGFTRFRPVTMPGKPLSEMIIEERRGG